MTDRRSIASAPVALLAALVLVATTFEGAFDLRHWAPLALFALVLLAAVHASGATRPVTRPIAVALTAIWAFTAWALLSAAWAESAERALEGGAQIAFYAAVVSAALLAVAGPRQMRAVGGGIVAGIVLVAALTLVRMHAEGTELFVAGRLESPAGYRNATAALFALAFWPLIGVAVTRGRNPSLRAAAFAGGVLCLALAFLTQSRGVIVGLAAGGLVALVLGTERIRRAFLALLALGGVLVLSGPLLVPYRAFEHGPGPVTASGIERATNALTFLVVDALVVGLLLALLDGGLRASVENLARARRIAVVGLAVGAIGLLTGAVLAAGNPISFVQEKVGEFQAIETRSSQFSELISTGGQRYDLWRVAVDEFAGSPVIGVGEGNYAFGYYAQRDSDRNLSNPHSLPFAVLAELGLVGLALLVTFFGSLGVALVRGVRGVRGELLRERHAVAGLAGAGTVLVAQSTVDWIWSVPGVTAIGLMCLALAAGIASARESERRAEEAARGRRSGDAAARRALLPTRARSVLAPLRRSSILRAAERGLREGLPLAGLATAGLVVLVLFAADYFAREARTAERPAAQLSAARTAAALNPTALTPLYLQAAAYEATGRVDRARGRLRQALELEPRNFATLGLLGDLETRAGDHAAASDLYARAAELNPRDLGLSGLARQAHRRAEKQAEDRSPQRASAEQRPLGGS